MTTTNMLAPSLSLAFAASCMAFSCSHALIDADADPPRGHKRNDSLAHAVTDLQPRWYSLFPVLSVGDKPTSLGLTHAAGRMGVYALVSSPAWHRSAAYHGRAGSSCDLLAGRT
jgi:hypothetical protein